MEGNTLKIDERLTRYIITQSSLLPIVNKNRGVKEENYHMCACEGKLRKSKEGMRRVLIGWCNN